MQAIAEALQAFRDVQGVHGSFIITLSGVLVARDLPRAFDNQLFAEVGPRIARLLPWGIAGVGFSRVQGRSLASLSRRLQCRPIPLPPPVTSATFPVKSSVISLLHHLSVRRKMTRSK